MKRYIFGILLWSFLGIALQTIAEEPKLVIEPQGHSALIEDLIFTPEGNTLISISYDKTIRLWDVETGDLIKTLRGQIGEGIEGMLQTGALSPDGKVLAVGGYLGGIGSDADTIIEYIRLLDIENGELIGLLKGHTDVVTDLAFSPDGKWVASGSDDDTLAIWDVSDIRGGKSSSNSQKQLPWISPTKTLKGHTSDISGVTFAPDGKKLVSSADEDIAILWDWQRKKILKKLKKHPEGVSCITYAPNGQYIVSGGWYGKILLWDGNGKFIKEIDEVDEIGTVSFSEDSKKIVVALSEHPYHALVYSIPSGKQLVTFTKHTNAIVTSAFYGNDWVATAGGDKRDMYIWDAHSGTVKTHITGKGNTVWAIALRKTLRQAQDERLEVAFGTTQSNDSNQGSLQMSFDFSEMSLHRNPPDENEFNRARLEYQGKKLQYKNEYELRIIGGKTIKIDPYNDGLIRSYTFTNNGDVVIGTSYVLNLYRNNGEFLHEFFGHTGEVQTVAVSEDGHFLVSGSDDQTIKLWNLHTGECLATLFVTSDNEWVCWTPQGYYAASAGGEKYIGWHLNQGIDKPAKFYPVSVFRKQFHQPELVKRTIALGSFEKAFAEFNIQDTTVTQMLPPKVQWISPETPTIETSQPAIRIQAKIQSESRLTAVKILVNGRTQAVGRGLVIENSDSTPGNMIDQEIPLMAGENVITIFAENENAGATSDERIVFYQAEETKKSNLYMVSIGISKYSFDELELEYADDDAKAVSQVFLAQEGALYHKVLLKELYDTDATQAKIKKAIEWLQENTTQNDVVMIFIAAHGTNEQGRYYLLPADSDPTQVQTTGISWNVFSDILGNLPSRVLLFLDTCHSGQLGQDVYALRKQVDNTEALRELSSDEYGVVILAASTGREFSLEHPDWEHGAFTKALVEALGQGQADYSNDGTVNLRELDMYVADRVEELTDNQQHPTTQKPSTISRFPIAQVK
jgi:WD40 repeat protein